uniref:Prevent-host-death protein n=1 Tax=Chlorobium chlorochromatii (strain CaD3) TaxID=340177 RepID=Q3ASQ6_CHLCH
MKTVSVSEACSTLSTLLKEVELGDEIGISFEHQQHTIAVLVPIAKYKKIKDRKLGSLAGKVKVEFSNDWQITDEELFNL